MTRLSVVVTRVGDDQPFEETLASILQHRPASCQVLAAHAGGYDDPYDISDEVTMVEVSSRASTAEALNEAVTQATGEVIHVVEGGVQVTENWHESALACFEDPHVGSVATLLKNAAGRERLEAAGVSYGSGGRRIAVGRGKQISPRVLQRCQPLGPCLQAAFYRRSALQEIGGFDKSIGDELLDVDTALTLQAAGYACQLAEDSQLDFVDPPPRPAHGFMAGVRRQRLFLRNAPQQGWLKALALWPFSAIWQSLVEVPHPAAATQLLGKCMASLEFWHYTKHWAKLRELGEPVDTVPFPGPEEADAEGADVQGAAGDDTYESVRRAA